MSAFDTALRRIQTIPREVLKQAFMPVRYDPTRKARYYDNTTPLSLEAVIIDKIIKDRVLPDINLVSGSEVILPLGEAEFQHIDQYNSIYRFGDKATGGRAITSVYEVTYGYNNNAMIGTYSGYGHYSSQSSMLLKASRDVLRGVSGTVPQSTAYVQLIGHNTVLVNDVSPIQNYGTLRCKVTNDPNLNNLKPQYHQKFASLCLNAAKSYVYTALVIDLDEGMLRGGQQIGRFREIVDSYADQEAIYIEELATWQKISILNDPVQSKKVMRLALGVRPKF